MTPFVETQVHPIMRYHAPSAESEPELWPHLVRLRVVAPGNPPTRIYVHMQDRRNGRRYLFSFAPDAPEAEQWLKARDRA